MGGGIIILGIIIYCIRKRFFFLYWIAIVPILFPLFNLHLDILNTEDFEKLYYSIQGPMYNLLLLLICIKLIYIYIRSTKSEIRTIVYTLKGVIPAFLVLVVFLLFQNIATHFDFFTLFDSFRVSTYAILPFVLLIIDEGVIPQVKDFFIFIGILLVLQLVWCLLELNGIYPYPVFYWDRVEGMVENLVAGTFPRFNSMSNFLTTVYLFISIDYHVRGKMYSWIYILVSLVILAMILMSGSRMSLFLYVFVLFLTLILYNKKRIQVLLFLAIFLLITMFIVGSGLLKDNEGYERIIDGLSQFFEKKGETTASLSSYLIDNYFYESPIWGNGLSWKGEYAYGMIDGNYKADARLAFVLVEYGILGLLFYMFYFLKIFQSIERLVPKQMKRTIWIVFAYFSFFMITESGFFDLYCLPYLFIYYFSVTKYYNVHKIVFSNSSNAFV